MPDDVLNIHRLIDDGCPHHEDAPYELQPID